MITYRSPTEEEREELLRLILDQVGNQSEEAMAFLGLTPDKFAQVYHSTGEVRVIIADGAKAGYVWIETRGRILHLHAIILHPTVRGKGIGTRVVHELAREFASRVDEIELGVQDSNAAALRFYERLGFRRLTVPTAPGFSILRLTLPRLLNGTGPR